MNENTAHPSVLLTGATGFLGAQVARWLLKEANLTLITLVRAETRAAAVQRLSRAWWDWPELTAALSPEGFHSGVRVEVLPGDVSLPQLGLEEAEYGQLVRRITHIIHTAGDLRLDAALDDLRKTNLQGTANLLELARLIQGDHGLKRYAHVSTAYVAGGRRGAIPEADLSGEHGFSNAYELSKYEAECLVQSAKSELPISVFRPGMVVGDSVNGVIRTFNTFYYPLRLYLTGKLRVIPADAGLPVNIVPVDYVAEAVARLTFCPEAEGLNFHITAPVESLPRAGELLAFVREWARERLGDKLPCPVFVRLPLAHRRYRIEEAAAHLSPRRKGILSGLNGLLTLLPYFNEDKQFQRQNTDRLMGPYPLEWRKFLPGLLEFAASQGFLHHTERTVHEQLLARLGSKSRPLRYFDIAEGKTIPRSAGEVRAEILAAAGALTVLGIRAGDRVAIVGLNSTRYLVLDAAIGLIGAVSVPLYYTSPPVEIDSILSASGARLLLVGAPKIMERLGEIAHAPANAPVVSFCRDALQQHRVAPAGLEREVIGWEAFLAMGKGCKVPQKAPVGFGDLATLRYTSGTTGSPKGVSFEHRHLRWMGQTMASLLPWKARNRTVTHLSFLPMNHVVEGILATYSPYYLPAAGDIYFLEDFKDIQRVLPQVRPTIFFSVPRIYERIWESLEANPVGRQYLAMPGGFIKRALGGLLRWQILKKTGLDRCNQLLAGSAPCGEGLLQNFRELGIEIHNAYGMTEAPLVTLNRLGANRLGTVGEPLPQTDIRIAKDGEVLVRGPQVMAGYYSEPGRSGREGEMAGQEAGQPFCDGWLLTGDLGCISDEGSLKITGRKKELFKTSYGKYVQPAKVESLLREIPGVAEALLVGDGKPYCTALLWTIDKEFGADAAQRLDRLVGRVNHGLSSPEQVKRWAVLANDLSIDRGDMTANFKMKRNEVVQRLGALVEELYNGVRPTQAVLHFGEAGKG